MFNKPAQAAGQEDNYMTQSRPAQSIQPARAVQQTKATAPRRNPFSKPSVDELSGDFSQMPATSAAYREAQPAATLSAAKPIERSIPSFDVSGSPSQLDVISMKPGTKSRTAAPAAKVPTPAVSRASSREPVARASPPVESSASLSPPKSTEEKTHRRQRSAGRIIESGISFIKGHIRNPSDQPKGHLRQASDPKTHSRQNSDQKPASHSRQGSGEFVTSKSIEDKPTAGIRQSASTNPKPTKVAVPNPFHEPSEGRNPFEDEPENPFTDETNPFLEDTNPFGEDTADTTTTNPFLEESTNPFE